MDSSFPPSYDETMSGDDFTCLGTMEDLANAQALVKNLKVFAALRPSDDAATICRVKYLPT